MGEMTDKEFLVAVRARIAAPEKWVKGNLAADSQGKKVSPLNDTAVCFCLVGAAAAAAGGHAAAIRGRLDGLVASFLPKWARGSIVSFNDASSTTHRKVLKLLDKAIAGCP